MQPSFLNLSDNRRLAYHLSEGKQPTVFFLGGFKSDMTGSKAQALEAYCQKHGQRFVRFDYTGHGASSGEFISGTIGNWKRDALDIITALADEKIILVGSSMGAWIALLIARELKERVVGLIGISSAPDFTKHLIWDKFNEEQKQALKAQGVFYAPSCYGEEPYPITASLIEEAVQHLLLDNPIPIRCPVRLLHGTHDEDVPWQHSVQLMDALESSDVRLQLVKNANHRLSETAHLQMLCLELESLINALE